MLTSKGSIYLTPMNGEMYQTVQDLTNSTIMERQLERDRKQQIDPSDSNLSILSIYEKPLVDIIKEQDQNGLIEYVGLVLDKLFPHPFLQEYIFENEAFEHVFMMGDRPELSFEYSNGFRPFNDDGYVLEWSIESVKDEPMTIKISWDTSVDYLEHSVFTIGSFADFAKLLFYVANESPYFETFILDTERSFVDDSEAGHLKYLDYHFVADESRLQELMKNTTPFSESHQSGNLIHLDDEDKLDYLSNYDGLGYLCREDDDHIIHVSTIVPDMDYELPKIYTDYFTHILWYNR